MIKAQKKILAAGIFILFCLLGLLFAFGKFKSPSDCAAKYPDRYFQLTKKEFLTESERREIEEIDLEIMERSLIACGFK